MRILFLNNNLREHGTYFRALDTARALVRRGHEALLWTASPDHWYRVTRETMADGVRVVETPSWNPLVNRDDGWGPLDLAWRMGRILREPFDLVYAFAHHPNVYLPARIAQTVRRKPMVVDWCDAYRDGIFPLRRDIRTFLKTGGVRLIPQRIAERVETVLERRILRKACAVTVISEELRLQTIMAGVDEGRVLCFPSGANVEAIRPMDKTICRRELGIKGEGPFLGYVANYNPDERFFLSAVAHAFRDLPGARLIATCPPLSERVIEANGLQDRIIRLGRLPFSRVPTVLGAADVLALPLADNYANRARWPHKFGDYTAAGRPIATCAIGDIANFVREAEQAGSPLGQASLCDEKAYGDAIVALLSHPDEWNRFGASARKIAETRLNWNVIGEQLDVFLSGVLE